MSGRSQFLGGPVPPLYASFPGVRGYVRVRKLVEAELPMTMEIRVVYLVESSPKIQFS